MFATLDAAVDELDLPVDGTAIAAALAAYDRLGARILTAVGEFDAASLWDTDGSTSMIAWLRANSGRSRRDAARLTTTARTLRALPVTVAALADGTLSAGQVEAIVANLSPDTTTQFAEIETDLVPTLAHLSVDDTARVMEAWKARATADGDEPEPERQRSLHLSHTLDGRFVLDGELDSDSGQVVNTALRLAESRDVDGEPARTYAERRADALVDLCRHFLDHQKAKTGGRHRPHVNVVVDLDDLVQQRGGRYADGAPITGISLATVLCDSGLHRLIMAGRSTILDYGTTTRTIPVNLWNALGIRDRHCRFPTATGRSTGARLITSCRSPRAGPPRSTSSCCSAAAITIACTCPAGT